MAWWGKRGTRVVMTSALMSVLMAANASADSVTFFTSDCGQAANSLVVTDSANPLGLTVTGPVSGTLTEEGSCTVSWTATRVLSLDAGFYAIGTIVDFDWVLDFIFDEGQFGFALLSWDITQSLVGTDANIAMSNSIFWVDGEESGHVSEAADTSLFPKYFEVAGGDTTLEQIGTLTLNMFGGSSLDAQLTFPVTSYVVQVPEPPPPIPEPATMLLLGTGVAAVFAHRRARTRA